ncbi:hypothetical protein D3C71_1161560 [compost metagenome]
MNSAVAAVQSEMTVDAPKVKACTAPTAALTAADVSNASSISFTPKGPGKGATVCKADTATCGKPGAGAP